MVLALLSYCGLGVIFVPEYAQARIIALSEPKSDKFPPLVKADSSLADWLNRARKCITDKDFGQAITILQALLEKPDAGFVRVPGSKGNYVSLRSEAIELLGTIPQEGLDRYRRLYDVKARKKLQDARKAGDLPALAGLAETFRFTSAGGEILEALAAVQFDRSLFTQAGRTWQKLLNQNNLQNSEQKTALLLAKTAVAFHLAGRAGLAGEFFGKLQKEFPSAYAVVVGRDQKLVTFVSGILARPIKNVATAARVEKIYPGWGGLPRGQGRMDNCDVILLPRWRYPQPAGNQKNVFPYLATKSTLASMSTGYSRPVRIKMSAEFSSGRVYFGGARSRNRASAKALPPMLRPVVFGENVIYRDDQRVRAVDMFTGTLRWESPALPLLRKHEQVDKNRRLFYNSGGRIVDRGQFGLTIGGDKIFTIHGFLSPNMILRPRMIGMGLPNGKKTKKGSALTAVSVETGKKIWTIGLGRGDEFLKTCRFISLPTYVSTGMGRLYMTALVDENYYVLCIDAETGKLRWKSQISQTPPLRNRYGAGWAGLVKMIGTPPAVADGRVFVCTNAGVIAAFDAMSGQPQWAYQYPSSLAGRRYSRNRSRSFSRDNPLIIIDGVVVAMPFDALNVFAMRVEDGKVAWQQLRGDMDHLVFVDDSRIALGSGEVRILDVATGKTIHESGNIGGFERPIVTKKNILLGGSDGIEKISLKDYARSKIGPVQGGGLLGNFVSIGPTLIAANSMGVCAYFSYEDGYDVLAKRLAGKSGADLARLFLQRGRLSFSAGEYEKTSDDLASCQLIFNAMEANTAEKEKTRQQLDRWLYITELAKGNSAAGPDRQQVMINHFTKALALAPGQREKAHTLLRLAKCCEKFGDMTQAIEWAQKLSQEFSSQAIIDIAIGPDAIDPTGNSPTGHEQPGRQFGNRFIERLIKIHGNEIYAKFNALAQGELDEAIAAGDPAELEAVAERWPLTQAATEAIFLAGEAYYRESALGEGIGAKENLAKATALLWTVANRTQNPRSISATTALVAVYTVAGWTQSAKLTRDGLAAIPPDTTIAFADIQGTLGGILKKIDEGKITVPVYSNQDKIARKLSANINPPLRKIFTLPGAYLLTDQEYRPVRIEQMVLVQQGKNTIMMDTSAQRAAQASRKKILARISAGGISKSVGLIPGMNIIAGGSTDGSIVALCSRNIMTAFHVETGRVLWSRVPESFGMIRMDVMGLGDDTLVVGSDRGKIVAVNFADGKIRWKGKKIKIQSGSTAGNRTLLAIRARRRRSGISSKKNSMINPPVIGGGLVAFSHYDGRGSCLNIFDLQSGELLDTYIGEQSAQVYITKAGQLVTMVDGQLAIRNRESFDIKKPLWEISYKGDPKPRILGVSNQYVAVSPNLKGKTVELVSLHSSAAARHIELKLETSKTPAPVPAVAIFDGPSVYVTFASHRAPSVAPQTTVPSLIQGPLLVRFDTGTGKELWQSQLAPGKSDIQRRFIVIPPTFGRSYLVLQMRGIRSTLRCYMIDKATGKIIQEIIGSTLGSRKNMKPKISSRGPKNSRQMNVPVITAGRLTVETDLGVTVYGK